MRIRTQFIIIMILFGIILAVLAVSAIITHQKLEKASQQENLASNIAQGASELSYLANDYLIYRENQQLKRWQSRFASFSNQMAGLNVEKPEQQVLVRNIRANEQRLKQVFESVVSAVGGPSPNRSTTLDLAFLQVSWSRMAVQSQGLVSDASRLSQLLHKQMDQLTETRTVLMYVMVGLFGLFLLASYMLTYRRILKSIVTLQADTAVIGSGNLDFVIKEKKSDEIGDLSHAFNQMTFGLKAVTASKADLEREVTERRRAEDELRQQREWLRVTLSSIGDAVIASDTEGRITFLNPVAVTLTGWKSEETLGQRIQDVFRIINEKTHAPAEDLVARVLSEKRVVALANDTALVTKDGREVPIEDSAAPIKDSAGNLIGVVLVFHDVTERRRAQAALREAHERTAWLARFPEQNPNPIIRASADGTVLYCNPASARLHGWTCEVGGVLQNELLPLVGRAMAEGREVQEDVQLDERFYIVWVAPFPEERYANIYGRDITERKRTEEALGQAHEQLALAQQSAGAGVWDWDMTTEKLEWSPELFRLFGLDPAKTKANFETWRSILHPKDREAAEEETRRAVRSHMRLENEYRIVLASGEERWISALGDTVYDADGRPLRMSGICIDITDRKRIEEELRQSEEKSRLLIKYAPSMIYEIDFHRPAFKSVNDTMCQFLGYSREELLAMNPFDLLDEEGKAVFRERIKRKLAGETINDFVEYKLKTKDGREVYGVLNISFTYKDGKPEGAVVVAHDITERKRAEEALRQRTLELQQLTEVLDEQVRKRTEELEEANQGLRQLSIKILSAQEEERKRIAGELHDTLGSYLGGIKFKVESAMQEIAKTPKAATQSLNTIVPVIQEAVEECRRIQQDLRPSMLDDLGLLPTLSWFCRRFQTLYSGIRVDKEMTIEESEVPPPLKIVAFRVTQEAMNNVAKHSKANSVRLCLWKIDGRMELVVEDNGRGFDIEKILDPESTRLGLGLSSMRERTELSGGSFEIESTQGKGTIIRASWPI